MNFYLYVAIMAVVTYLIRMIPLVVVQWEIKNRFIKSFLYYVPYAALASMTFPAIVEATQSPVAGLLALICGILMAWFHGGLFEVAVVCCAITFVAELFLK